MLRFFKFKSPHINANILISIGLHDFIYIVTIFSPIAFSTLTEKKLLAKKSKIHKIRLFAMYCVAFGLCIPLVIQNMTYNIEVCNHSDKSTVYTSVAYFDPIEQSWVGKGWFPTELGKCQTLVRHVSPPVYVYSESTEGNFVWGDKAIKEQGLFCIHDAAPFEFKQTECNKPGVRWQQFRKLPTPFLGGTLTWSLSPPMDEDS